MLRRILLIVLLAITVIAVVGREASARVCVMKIGGYCTMWSGSVECGIGATGIGNVLQDPVFLGCEITASNTMWAVACGNPGGDSLMSPGINLVLFDGNFSGTYQLTDGDVDRNGNAYTNVIAYPSNAIKEALLEAGACPNTNWSVIDAVPCDMTVIDKQMDAKRCVTSDAWYDCSLPNCGTLQWDAAAQKFERRQYECTKLSTHMYKCP